MKKLKNNKGVAFVTVLISITFITILAVSLLYMAYLNYLTKSMRSRANDNFYTGEFGVDEVAACLQQKAASVKSSGGGIEDAKKAIKTAVGGTVDIGAGTYDPAKVTALINVANSDGSTITVSSTDPQYVVSATSVKLKNLRFDTTDASGFTSTIYTDMSVQFQSTPPGDFDINDFSVISDSIIAVNGDGQGSNNYSGCVYLKDSGDGYALRNDKKTLISLLCPVGILDGDLEIENKPSAVSIAGDVMVRGDVIVGDGCSLAVSGTLKISGELKKSGDCRIVGASHITEHVNMDALPTDGLAGAVFAKHVYAFNFDNNGGPAPKIYDMADYDGFSIDTGSTVEKNLKYEDDMGNKHYYPIVFYTKGGGDVAICETEEVCPFDSSRKFLAYLNLPDGKLNESQIPGGALVLSHRNLGVEGKLREVTMLTLGKMTSYNNGEVSMTKMSKEGYEAAKNALFIPKMGANAYKTSDGDSKSGSGENINGGSPIFVGGDFRDFCEAMCSGDWVVYGYDVDSGVIDNSPLIGVNTTEAQKKNMEKTVYKIDENDKILDVDGNVWDPSSGKEKAIAISTDDARRYLVFKAGSSAGGNDLNNKFSSSSSVAPGNTKITMMLPYGYFLSSNTSATVSKYVSSTSAAEDPDVTTVRYDNWFKE